MTDFATIQRLSLVMALARDVWKTDGEAREFLNRPHPLLNQMSPNETVALGETETMHVVDLIGRLKYGISG